MSSFPKFGFVHVHDDDDVDDDNDDVVKMCDPIPRHHGIGFTSQLHSTMKPIPRCIWSWLAKSIPQHLETNSTEPRNSIVYKNRNSAVLSNHFHDQLNKFHEPIEETPWCHGIGVTDYTDP